MYVIDKEKIEAEEVERHTGKWVAEVASTFLQKNDFRCFLITYGALKLKNK